eukprot:1785830-Ditylum_brightwellii.AAC.1
MAKVIWDGLYDLASAAFTTFFKVQGIEQIKNFLRPFWSDSNTSQLLRILLSWAKHQMGWHKSILHEVKTPLSHFEARWIISLCKYLAKIAATIETDNCYVYPKQRIFDKHIMPRVCKSGIFADKEIQQINYCWIYLNVTTLATIVLTDGTTLDPHMYQGQCSLLGNQLKHMEIHQEHPGEQS